MRQRIGLPGENVFGGADQRVISGGNAIFREGEANFPMLKNMRT
ncbi:hypothetical protein [Hongsoonwoonella zoysiae]|nr:hypothetical protein [Hongsoonwoonella zoysiae]